MLFRAAWDEGRSNSHRLATIRSLVFLRALDFDDLKTTAADAVVVVLYVVRLVALQRWSRHAPIVPPDGAAGPPIREAMPWDH